MTIFVISTYKVKPEKQAEHTAWGKNLVATMKTQPDLFKEVKSLKVCRQKTGRENGRYIAIWEFENMADRRKWIKRLREQTALVPDLRALTMPGTFESHTWKPIKTMHRTSKYPTHKK
jgi:antibiotic biosynthesis monooxygenase (ABM) superfamily enzyme